MAFPRLKFTKLWTNSADFPAIQTDEKQVRADMQALHDESLAGLNSLAESLEAESAGGNIGVKMPAVSGNTEKGNLQQAIEALNRAIQLGGAVPGGGTTGQVLGKASDEDNDLTWQDSIPEYLSKENVLSSGTKEMFGLPESAVPDDAFSKIKNLIDAGMKTEIGSYVGTGAAGRNNPSTLRFSFAPKLLILFIGGNVASFTGYSEFQNGDAFAISCPALFDTDYSSGGVLNRGSLQRLVRFPNIPQGTPMYVNFYSKRNKAGTEISWYAEYNGGGNDIVPDVELQMNISEETYEYLAIG